MSVQVGDGGEVVATSGRIPAAPNECVVGRSGADRIMSAGGAGHAVGNGIAPPEQYAGGRSLVK